jgi:DNA-binding CsgD family transcriptional regulator
VRASARRTRTLDTASPADAARGIVSSKDNIGVVLDAVRQARRLSAETGASYHGVFVVDRSRGALEPSACFDCEFPLSSDLTRTICGPHGAEWLATRKPSMTPLWWICETGAQQCPAFPILACAVQAPVLTPGLSGVALPVFAEDGVTGHVVLAGRDIALDDALLCDLHIRAFTLFGAVARLRLAQSETAPLISKREMQCLKLTANGNTSEEIADRLGLSVHTANQYLAATTQKLNAVNRMHAVAKALRMGLID